MKTLKITVAVLVVAIIVLLLHTKSLNDQLKETQSALTEAQASYERCVDKNERFQEFNQAIVDENSHLIKVIRKYEPDYGIVYF